MNNKGFAISSIVYAILIVFLILVVSILSLVVTRGSSLDKIKKNAIDTVKGIDDNAVSMDHIVADFTTFNITSDASNYVTIDYNINVISPEGNSIEASVDGNTITYTDSSNNAITRTLNNNAEPKVENYDYTGSEEKIFITPGLYKLEVWGAENSTTKGGYSVGYFYTSDKKMLYLNIGGKNKGYKAGYNNGTTLIKTNNEVLISAMNGNQEGNLSSESLSNKSSFIDSSSCSNATATSSCTKEGNGYIKITSLIYFTK